MLIKKSKIEELSVQIRRCIDGESVDFRDEREGVFSLLKNDIHDLASIKDTQLAASRMERERLANHLADVSHQLKTPICSMSMMAELLEEAPPERQAEFVSNIRQGLRRMEWLTDTLLKMARLDSGTVELSPANLYASELLKKALEPLNIMLDVKNQRVTLQNDAVLSCDPRWTAEALSNLLKNALESSPEGGEIIVDSGENPLYSWVSVRDSGSGIAREDIPGLFRRYSGSKGENGFGIGLPLALAIVSTQNGDIDVDGGGNGAGATFTVKLFK